MTEREMRIVTPMAAEDDLIGRWLWALEDARARTVRLVRDLDQQQLDTVPPGLTNSIGTLLYHIALIEADYLCVDVLGMAPDTLMESLMPLFPLDGRGEDGNLSPLAGVSASEHIARLDAVRHEVIAAFGAMAISQFDARRNLADWPITVSPAWVIYHLTQHEAEHRGEIRDLITLIGG